MKSSQKPIQISFICPSCSVPYNENEHYPIITCQNQHMLCKKCYDKMFEYSYSQAYCLNCKVRIIKNGVKFHYMKIIKQIIKDRQQKSKQLENMKKLLKNQGKLYQWLILQCQQKDKNMYKIMRELQDAKIGQQKMQKQLADIKINQIKMARKLQKCQWELSRLRPLRAISDEQQFRQIIKIQQNKTRNYKSIVLKKLFIFIIFVLPFVICFTFSSKEQKIGIQTFEQRLKQTQKQIQEFIQPNQLNYQQRYENQFQKSGI